MSHHYKIIVLQFVAVGLPTLVLQPHLSGCFARQDLFSDTCFCKSIGKKEVEEEGSERGGERERKERKMASEIKRGE